MKATLKANVLAEPDSSRPGLHRRNLMFAAALAPTLALPFGASNAATTIRADVVRAVFDRRFPQSLAFAERAESQGIRQVGISGEISTLWFDEILPALHARPMPLIIEIEPVDGRILSLGRHGPILPSERRGLNSCGQQCGGAGAQETVRGHVVDHDGAALPQAEVQLVELNRNGDFAVATYDVVGPRASTDRS